MCAKRTPYRAFFLYCVKSARWYCLPGLKARGLFFPREALIKFDERNQPVNLIPRVPELPILRRRKIPSFF